MPPAHRQPGPDAQPNPDGTTTITGLPGFDAFTFAVRAAVIEGQPRLTSLHIDPTPGTPPQGIATVHLRDLALKQLAVLALNTAADPDLRDRMQAVANRPDNPRHHRAKVTTEKVAELYRLAVEAGSPAPRAEVCALLAITERTATRYLTKARDQGLLAPN